jgi:tRNA (cmo5U34)-methyltransferase
MNASDYNGGHVSVAALQDMPTALLDSTKHKQAGPWEFDQDVTDCFEDMLERSIPQLSTMRSLVSSIATRHLRDDDWFIDLGCSRGGTITSVIGTTSARINAVGLEVSAPMVRAARQSLMHRGDEDHHCEVKLCDIVRDKWSDHYPSATVVSSVLTLMFTPINYRQRILSTVHKSLTRNGVFILVEKVLAEGPDIEEWMVEEYHQMKMRAGYDAESIEEKKRSLEGRLVPVTCQQNIDMLRRAGFSQVDCFWRCLNFVGIVAYKNV